MCTVSVVPRPGGFRLVCNRDERFTRPAAESPQMRRVGRRVAIFPVDPQSGGTWVGVNDAGLAVAVLNRNAVVTRRQIATRHVGRPTVSRGVVVPQLLSCGSIDDACSRLTDLDWATFEPFRVLLADARRVALASVEGTNVLVDAQALTKPTMVTSSSLGDDLVEGPRRVLFRDLVLLARDPVAGQNAFHVHQWADRPHISVRMRRPDAATVSRTWIESTAAGVRVGYEAPC